MPSIQGALNSLITGCHSIRAKADKSTLGVALWALTLVAWVFLELENQTHFLNFDGKMSLMSESSREICQTLHTFVLWNTRVVAFLTAGIAFLCYAGDNAGKEQSKKARLLSIMIIAAWALLELDKQTSFLNLTKHIQAIPSPLGRTVSELAYSMAVWGARAATIGVVLSAAIRRFMGPPPKTTAEKVTHAAAGAVLVIAAAIAGAPGALADLGERGGIAPAAVPDTTPVSDEQKKKENDLIRHSPLCRAFIAQPTTPAGSPDLDTAYHCHSSCKVTGFTRKAAPISVDEAPIDGGQSVEKSHSSPSDLRARQKARKALNLSVTPIAVLPTLNLKPAAQPQPPPRMKQQTAGAKNLKKTSEYLKSLG